MRSSLAATSLEGPGSDPSAPIAALFDEHCAFVCRVLRHHGVDDATLDDAVQDVFVTAYRRWSSFEGRSSARSWLYGIARRIASRYRRSADARARRFVATDEPAEGLDEPFDRAHAAHSLATLLERIDRDKRLVLVLSELEGMTAPEIAEALQIPVGTVYSRLRAAWQGLGHEAGRERQRLRRGLQGLHPTAPAPERRRRMWGMIAAGLGPASSVAPVATGVGWVAQIKWVVVGAALGAGLVGARLAMVEPAARVPVVPTTARSPVEGSSPEHDPAPRASPALATAPAPDPAPARPPGATAVPPASRVPSPPSPTRAPTTTAPAEHEPTDDLAAELALLRDAKRAIQRGRGVEALALLERHAQRFPRGQLADERRAARIAALCLAGRADDAAREAAALGRDPAAACSS